ncbi:MAG: hypothetical protein AVDCRST_MAG29-2529 [uncultured Nocardioidaceae bacterium]|uniref:Uncharacterized protein n=1 Tax=uncultured Nocardioidaceae bacterium TaxID=253824 RepID=A0A6J4MD19_9ACTN|nr:MAG: hypothetical protein AVDCRST_MAG29-2529 [uncultured Nocardioidaceae bacterium]
MLLRHRNTVGSTRHATRLNRSPLRGLRSSSSPEARRNALYSVIAQHSPQADLPTLVRLVG